MSVAHLPDGREVAGDVDVAGAVAPGPARDAAVAKLEQSFQRALRDRNQSGAPVRRRRDALVPVLAAQIEPMLPPASPARTEILRDSAGRITRQVAIPATPAPRPTAVVIAKKVALSVLSEVLIAEQVDRDVHQQQERAANITRRLLKAADDVLERRSRGPNIPGTTA